MSKKPGTNIGLPLPDVGAATNLKTNAFTLKDFIAHLVPRSVAEAMANNEILQIVVFSIFFGTALAALFAASASPIPLYETYRQANGFG